MEIRDIQPSLIEWEGELTNIVFTYDCNWRCKYCFQKDLLKPPDILISNDDALRQLIHDKEKFDINAVEIIGGEPMLQPDLIAFLKELKRHDFKVMIATNGSFPAKTKDTLPYVDFYAVDYKTTFDEYEKLIRARFSKNDYLETIKLIKKKNYLIRTTYLKGYHDNLITKMANELTTFTDTEHYIVQQGIYKNTLDPRFKFETSTKSEAKYIEKKIKEAMRV